MGNRSEVYVNQGTLLLMKPKLMGGKKNSDW